MPRLSRITLYPVKALPGVEVSHCAFTRNGALAHDREYALFDSGGYINGKRRPEVHTLDASCKVIGASVQVHLRTAHGEETFDLDPHAGSASDHERLQARLAEHFRGPVRIGRQTEGGFPDDPDSPGPTVISAASLAEVAAWFPALGGDIRHRFRANLEFDDCPAFWEDRLYGAEGEPVAFRIGEATLLGINPCRRCVVPSRDPSTGEAASGFQRTFVERRRATLPAWAERSRFDMYYRLAVNTRASGDLSGSTICVGDAVEIIEQPRGAPGG